MTLRWKSRGWLLTLFGAACLAAALWAVLRPPVPGLAARWPEPAAIDSLARYVLPAPALPEGGYVFVPPERREPTTTARRVDSEPAPVPDWRISAIVISGGRSVAIIDGRPVRTGEELPDGTRVEAIAPDRVALVDASGGRHTLRISLEE